MRIAVLGIKSLPAFGGADRVVERVIAAMPEAHRFDVYVRADQYDGTPYPDPRVRRVPVRAPGGKHLGPFVYLLGSALRYLRGPAVDVVHVHNTDFGYCVPLLRLRRARVLGTMHGDPFVRKKWGPLASRLLRASEAIFARACHALTSVERAKAERYTERGVPVEYIPNGVDAAPPSAPAAAAALLAQYGLEAGGFALFACARLDRDKGLLHLLRAAGSRGLGIPLLVVGDFTHDRGHASEVRELARELPGVHLHEALLEQGALFSVVRASRVCVFPSDFEAMSMQLLEYIALERPVVCSDIPQNLEVVGEAHPARFRAGDPHDLRRALDAALADPARAARDARALRTRVLERFAWGEIAARYVASYEKLRGAARAPAAAAKLGAGERT